MRWFSAWRSRNDSSSVNCAPNASVQTVLSHSTKRLSTTDDNAQSHLADFRAHRRDGQLPDGVGGVLHAIRGFLRVEHLIIQHPGENEQKKCNATQHSRRTARTKRTSHPSISRLTLSRVKIAVCNLTSTVSTFKLRADERASAWRRVSAQKKEKKCAALNLFMYCQIKAIFFKSGIV